MRTVPFWVRRPQQQRYQSRVPRDDRPKSKSRFI